MEFRENNIESIEKLVGLISTKIYEKVIITNNEDCDQTEEYWNYLIMYGRIKKIDVNFF